MASLPIFRIRTSGFEHFPKSGGVLVLSNHQSHLDPPLLGMMIPRQVRCVARRTLFDNKIFGGLIHSIGAIPLDRDGLGISGVKETLKALKSGEPVLLFPEGTRSKDGALQPLKPGFSALATRGNVPIVPMAIAGAYDAMPRGAKLPRPGRISIAMGEAISPAAIREVDERALITLVAERIAACFATATAICGTTAPTLTPPCSS
jgi:1-acyl-sn-glycerol-3-phosphate acyltransferase